MSRNYTGTPTTELKQYIGQVSNSNPTYVRKDLLLARGYTDLVLYTWSGTAYVAIPTGSYNPQYTKDNRFSDIAGVDIYTQFTISGATYYDVDIYADFTDYGAMTDADIRSDELRETSWKPNEDYNTVGETCRYYGVKYISYTTNDKTGLIPPLSKNNWFPVPDRRELVLRSSEPMPIGGIHGIHDRASSNYQSYLAVDEWSVGATTLRSYLVHLDGSTPDTTLQAALDAYDYTSYFTDTGDLIDMGDYVNCPQSSGGDADTLGELVDDQFQLHRHGILYYQSTGGGDPAASATQVSSATGYTSGVYASGSSGTPRTGSTTHGKRFTTGTAYIYITVNTADL